MNKRGKSTIKESNSGLSTELQCGHSENWALESWDQRRASKISPASPYTRTCILGAMTPTLPFSISRHAIRVT